ncbi:MULTISPECIES: FKBP-type peptidyl-prolyl cis-trans isomerase [Parabacteroides]|uniref:FKBP-type peptidyl-prolyl cis-trans isomerase n=1 Tax=Parabacteroides provencensis TaxID=1944636 RepID=UPI000C147E00|nr:FKBP-type peptidyl-prolyl cis-trans isomerase [Parabacteroides provencensis]
MKKYLQIALMLFCVLVVSSCSKNEDALEVDEAWKIENDEAFQAQIFAPGFQQLKSQSNEGFILYKVIKEGEGKEPIYYTSTVKAYYKGTLIDGTVFESHTFEEGAPSKFEVSGVVDGWTTALQHMHVGDKWEIWIPQQLGYGASGKKAQAAGQITILPYTTLIFELEVAEIVKQ